MSIVTCVTVTASQMQKAAQTKIHQSEDTNSSKVRSVRGNPYSHLVHHAKLYLYRNAALFGSKFIPPRSLDLETYREKPQTNSDVGVSNANTIELIMKSIL